MDACLAPRWHLERNLEITRQSTGSYSGSFKAGRLYCRIGNQFFKNGLLCCGLCRCYYFLLCLPVIYRWSHFTLLTCAFFKKGKLTKMLCMLYICIVKFTSLDVYFYEF